MPRHQPFEPGVLHESPEARRETEGAVASRLTVTEFELVPPPLVAWQVTTVPFVSKVMVVVPHPEADETDDCGSETDQVTVTSLR